MQNTLAIWITCLMAIAIVIVPAWAGPAEATEATVANEQLAGTVLIMVPQIDYERAVLRVAGPEGYGLVKRLAYGSPIKVDLLTESETISRDRAEIAGWHVDPATLRDGKYNYELVLFDELGQRHVQSGSFSVAGGTPVAREARPPQVLNDEARMTPARADQMTNLAPESHGEFGDFDDFASIRNQNGAGQSRLNFNTTDSIIINEDTWRLANDADTGNFELSEGGFTTHLVMRQGGNVGLGVGAPLSPLHIDRTEGFQIRLEGGDGADYRMDAFGTSLRIGPTTNANVFKIFGDAPLNALTVSLAGVGVGTASPLAMLHVMGGGIIEGDVALGSSRTIKHEIEPLDGGEILDAIRSLPLYSWKYKDDPLQASHVGPMAEDVHAAFHLGRDEKHLSPADSAGLALAAIQGVDVAVSELLASNLELASENRDLRERLATIEARLDDLLAAIETAAE